MRCACTEQSSIGGSGGILPRKILNFTLPCNLVQINMKSNRLGYCKHTSYTNRGGGGGGSLNVWGRSWGVWGGSFPLPPPLDRTLIWSTVVS